jgi:hypothetical protein
MPEDTVQEDTVQEDTVQEETVQEETVQEETVQGDEREGTSLDLLEREDRKITDLYAQMEAHAGSGVEDRAEYGILGKELVRRITTRESALVDVATAAAEIPAVATVGERLGADPIERRERIEGLEKMSRGVQGMYLNTGMDFDGELANLMTVLRPQIAWELGEAIPALRLALSPTAEADALQSARYVSKHSPTHVHPAGSRWYQRAPVIARLVSLFHHWSDFPRASRGERPHSN